MYKVKRLLALMLCGAILVGCGVSAGMEKTGTEPAKEIVRTGNGEEAAEATKAAEIAREEEKLAKKYEFYVPCDCDYEYCQTWDTIKDVENVISKGYGTWYDRNGNGTLEIAKDTINGRTYCVTRCTREDSPYFNVTTIEFHYTGKPDEGWMITIEDEEEKTKDGGVVTVRYLDMVELGAVTCYEYCEMEKKDLVELTGEGRFSKQQVYNRTKSDFDYYYNGAYSMTEQLYMTVEFESVEDATFHYDPDMDEYKIRFKVTINENVFDVLGFSEYTCVLRASYTEKNGKLEEVSFELD